MGLSCYLTAGPKLRGKLLSNTISAAAWLREKLLEGTESLSRAGSEGAKDLQRHDVLASGEVLHLASLGLGLSRSKTSTPVWYFQTSSKVFRKNNLVPGKRGRAQQSARLAPNEAQIRRSAIIEAVLVGQKTETHGGPGGLVRGRLLAGGAAPAPGIRVGCGPQCEALRLPCRGPVF